MHNPITPSVSSSQQGLVISYFGSSVAVETDSGQVFQCHLRRNQELPVVGDLVSWEFDNTNSGVITGILPRRSILSRGDAHGKLKPLAANIDVIVAVMVPPPGFSEHLINRYLIAAELLGIEPLVVINKIDLITEDALAATKALLQPYAAIPYPILYTSLTTQVGVAELKAYLAGKNSVLIGPSGVGKSSIITALSGHDIRTTEVSPKGAGKHTTTATRLYHLAQGGCLIDSPGVREFNLWPITPEQVISGFKEFQPYLQGCRFRDCQHVAEPDCTVQTAVKNGKISLERYTRYQELMKEALSQKKNGGHR